MGHDWTEEDQSDFDLALEEVGDMLIDKAKSGEISWDAAMTIISPRVNGLKD
jgi:hypothetical protein